MKAALPSIRHDQTGFGALTDLNAATENVAFEDIEIDLTGATWFDADMCATFGAILYRVSADLNEIKLTGIRSDVEAILCRNGFLSHYGREKTPDRKGVLRIVSDAGYWELSGGNTRVSFPPSFPGNCGKYRNQHLGQTIVYA